MSAAPLRKHVLGLDGLRALAALAVVAYHATPLFWPFGLGSVGVRVFFVLSGFLIVGGLHVQRKAIEAGTTTVTQALGHFWGRRVRRIFPLYYLTLVAFIAVALPAEQVIWTAVFGENLYIEHVLNHWASPRTSYPWSLAVEEQFYALAAPTFLLTATSSHARVIAYMGAAGVLATVAYLLAGTAWMPLYVSPFPNITYFALGALIAIVPLPRLPVWIACLVLTPVALKPFWHQVDQAALLGLDSLLSALGCAALVAVTVQHQQSAFVRGLERIRGLGTISYGIYMIHPWLQRVGSPWDSPWLSGVWYLLQLAATLLLATLSWRLIERPVLQSAIVPRWLRVERRRAS